MGAKNGQAWTIPSIRTPDALDIGVTLSHLLKPLALMGKEYDTVDAARWQPP
jgi:hypothetical protein